MIIYIDWHSYMVPEFKNIEKEISYIKINQDISNKIHDNL